MGAVARTHLRETPEFIDAKRQLKKKLEQALEKAEVTEKQLENSAVWKEKVNNSTSLAVFLLQCAWSVCFYIIYFHCGNIMKNNFGFTSEEIIHQNFIVSIFQIFSFIIWTYLSYRIYPLILLRIKIIIFGVLILIFPYLLNIISTPSSLLILQVTLISFSLNYSPAIPILFKHIPIFKHFTYASLLYALSRTFMSILTSFGLVYFTEYFGNWGISIITVPIILSLMWGISHFFKLEKNVKNYP